ncbi:hypothetical protein SLEP1_g13720 [Rubroshorea leprosula]|uniref:Uncharacterized protein n=1 Tax=Rubroshorea leprosula TaxID=152421 RepID=A0AAV5IQN6_9ROSI|nr:hypothetical protein SLEP1_g13720 [Rubroshorea leprosula]
MAGALCVPTPIWPIKGRGISGEERERKKKKKGGKEESEESRRSL